MLSLISCKSKSDDDKTITVNLAEVNKKRVVTLLDWVLEPEFIALDSSCEEAYTEGGYCCLSDNYMGKYGFSQVYKLYDRRTGKFLRNIGKAGKNSGEYSNVYNSVIDEQNSRVYILSWNAKELLCHDLNTGDLTVAALPFEGMNEVVAWKQDKTWGGRVDSLYVVKDGFLKPIYTMNFLKGDQKTATTSTSI